MKTEHKLKTLRQARVIVSQLKKKGKKVVFTNGCFDLLHLGHITYLQAAKKKGDVLVLGLNSDASVKKIKGATRPILPEFDRAGILSALSCVDFIVLFKEATPLRLIKNLKPNILVKGADWKTDNIVGSDIVKSSGGKVQTITYLKNRSSSKIIKDIIRKHGKK
ncbi:D-glycero-beta-D-manno-heptose 1-phosphate adenylyltransferase [Candidatus Omnitrophota bacterium]